MLSQRDYKKFFLIFLKNQIFIVFIFIFFFAPKIFFNSLLLLPPPPPIGLKRPGKLNKQKKIKRFVYCLTKFYWEKTKKKKRKISWIYHGNESQINLIFSAFCGKCWIGSPPTFIFITLLPFCSFPSISFLPLSLSKNTASYFSPFSIHSFPRFKVIKCGWQYVANMFDENLYGFA